MKDVALKAGVSKGTVSKALNKSWSISPALREKILKTCEELGYRMDCNIQDLIHKSKTGATRDIGFVIVEVDFSDLAYVQLLDGIVKGVDERHLRLSLIKLSGKEEKIFDLPPVLRDRRVSGIIVSGSLSAKTMELLTKLEIPYVIIGNYSEEILGHGCNVELDINYMMYHLVGALKKHNRTRIAYYYEMPDNFFFLQCRDALKASLKLHQLEYDERLMYAGKGKYFGLSQQIIEDIKKDNPPFDSIICMDHRTSLDLSHIILLETSSDKPKNIVLGVLRSYAYEHLPVPTIYVDANFDRLALEGINLLDDLLKSGSKTEPKRLLIKPTIETELKENDTLIKLGNTGNDNDKK